MEGLLWFLGFGLFFYVMMRYGCGAHMVHGRHGGHEGPGGGGSDRDPVCGMQVSAGSGYTKMHEGRRYAFCSRSCLEKFEADPAKYTVAAKGGAS